MDVATVAMNQFALPNVTLNVNTSRDPSDILPHISSEIQHNRQYLMDYNRTMNVSKREACCGLKKAIDYLQSCHSATKSQIQALFAILQFIEEQTSLESSDNDGLGENEILARESNVLQMDTLDNLASDGKQKPVYCETTSEALSNTVGILADQCNIQDHCNLTDTQLTSVLFKRDDEDQFLSLPCSLTLRRCTSDDNVTHVFSQVSIKKGSCFGPCPTDVIRTLADSRLVLSHGKDEETDSVPSWMSFVHCTEDDSLGNLEVIKRNKEMYFEVTQDIPQNTELLLRIQHAETMKGKNKVMEYSESPERFGNQNDLQKYAKLSIKQFRCDQCGKNFKSNSSLHYHKKIHSGRKEFKCHLCEKLFAVRSALKTHLLTHSAKKPFACSDCGKTFAQHGNLISHRRVHTGEKPFTCSVCGQRFAHRSTIKAHMYRHTGERNHQCPMCGKRYGRADVLKIHLNTHSSEKNHKCDICGKAFTHQGYVQTHKKMHVDDKPYLCTTCGQRFIRAQSLKRHIDCVHLKLGKKHPCLNCGKIFKRQYHLVRHMRTAHKDLEIIKTTTEKN